jgi:hypothetical protein
MGFVTDYHKCRKPDCFRKVSLSSLYCCTACTAAAEAPAPYEIEPYRPGVHWIHVHSQSCEERAAERGEYTWAEVVQMGVLPG